MYVYRYDYYNQRNLIVYRNIERYCSVNEEYYNILKKSKIIVTANPYSYEGDYRLYEALLSGNLVMCDEMLGNDLLKNPFINKIYLVLINCCNHYNLSC